MHDVLIGNTHFSNQKPCLFFMFPLFKHEYIYTKINFDNFLIKNVLKKRGCGEMNIIMNVGHLSRIFYKCLLMLVC